MKHLSLSFVGLFGLLLALSASPVLAQSDVEQLITFYGSACKVVVDFGAFPPNPIYLQPEEGVIITFIDANDGRVRASTTSGAGGSFQATMTIPLKGRWVYAIATKPGFRPTASFVFHVPDDVGGGVIVPIVENGVFDHLVHLSQGVHQPIFKRSMILALFHPTGQWPIDGLTPQHFGVALDARETFNPYPTAVPEVPPGDRRWMGYIRPAPIIVPNYRISGFRPFALVIYNAHRWRHPVDHRVRAYRVGRLDAWPAEGVMVCPGGVIAGAAPTPVDITVGVVRCRPFKISLVGSDRPS